MSRMNNIKKREGKSLIVKWPVKTNNQYVDLSGRDLRVEIINPYARNNTMSFHVEGYCIIADFPIELQKGVGIYQLKVWENFGTSYQTVEDACQDIELVPRTYMENDGIEGLDNEEVVIAEGNLELGVPGPSNYQLALKHGFTGTEEEYLESLALHYDELTPEQIAELKKPATDAATEANKTNDAIKVEEGKRVSAESTRVEQERERVSNENLRTEAEAQRIKAEGERTKSETLRSSAESDRAKSEAERSRAETLRNTAETKRAETETSRSSAEKIRSGNEDNRVTEEGKRADAEAARIREETARVTEFETIRRNAEKATNAANTAAETANKAATTIDDKIKPIADNDRMQDEKLRMLEEYNGDQDKRIQYIEYKAGISPAKRWKNGELVEKDQAVIMHGETFVAKQATKNPPMGTLMDEAGNRIINEEGGYVLTGEYNLGEYIKL